MTPAPLLDPTRLPELRDLLAELGVDGWLLFDFRDQNPIAHSLLGLGKTTRRAFALFPVAGDPILLHHAIEASAWGGWPWAVRTYSGWREMEAELRALLSAVETVAMEVSPGSAVPTVDRVPSGIVELVRGAGATPVSSGDLVSVFHSRWSEEGIRLHRKAARIVQETAHRALARAGAAAAHGEPFRELELMDWIRTTLVEVGLEREPDCIVAIGERAADPHYHPVEGVEPLERGSLVLIDLWGAHPGEGIFADQTWMGFLGEEPPARAVHVWEAVRGARDAALALLEERGREGREVRGFEVDDAARRFLEERGLAEHFIHRLGHSIDRELHGSGPNLDHLESRDERRLLPGVGFSVEPGVYIPGEIGVRAEVNVLWTEEGPEVTTPDLQRDLILHPGE